MNDSVKKEHPSFGLLQFARTQSSKSRPLFGSSVAHSATIRMSVSTAEINRSLNFDSYYPVEEIIEVEMSPTQFADAITSMNIGMGVPVTIIRRARVAVEDCPSESKREQFENEFRDSVKKISENLTKMATRAQELLKAGGTLKKPEREELLGLIYHIEQDTRANLPFIASQFNEQMDKTVTEAKGEVEGFIHNLVTTIGVAGLGEALAKQAPQLTDTPAP